MSVILITGRPGSGKTTHAYALAKEYADMGDPAMVLDGDEIRTYDGNRDFSDAGRRQNLKKMAIMAAQIEKQGVVAIVAAVAPKREWRDAMRAQWKESRLCYLPGGSLWPGTTYERPGDDEF